MDQHTQKQYTGKQGRFGKVATTAVLAVALAMIGLMPMQAGSLDARAGGSALLQSTPPANDSMCAPELIAATEPASLALATNADTDAAPMTIRDLLDGTTTAQACWWGFCHGVYGCWIACW
jgi:hypothetical protein